MTVTYIGHSGFLIELPHSVLLFDVLASQEPPVTVERYSIGQLPPLDPEKQIFVFVSHAHKDHYSHAIWDLRKRLPHVRYILAKSVPLSSGFRRQLGLTEEDMQLVLRVNPGETHLLRFPGTGDLRVEAFQSTDQGVAFWVEAEGRTFFHAGDLHLWLWEEEGDAYMEKMQADFDSFTAPLAGRTADAAFLPLDGRLEARAFDGMDAYLALMHVKACFPMHFWKDYDLIRRYKDARKDCPRAERILEITKEGQSFELP